MKMREYRFQSCFAPYLEAFLCEKRAAGFIYGSEEWKLKHFDAFCVEKSVTEPCLSRDLIKEWGTLRNGEALATCSARTSVIRQFSLFLNSLGMEAYIPSNFCKAEKTMVHILPDAEIKSFFEAVDDCVPAVKAAVFHRLAAEYKVIFRLIYCCGLRISEARKLHWKDVDLQRGTIHIYQSKGHKNRLIYMATDMTELLQIYAKVLRNKYVINTTVCQTGFSRQERPTSASVSAQSIKSSVNSGH